VRAPGSTRNGPPQIREASQAYERALQAATAQGVNGGKEDALNGLALLYDNVNHAHGE
jgi:hypothetical protein